jgi:aminoglycoside 6'-N-acetyltransferase
MSEVSLIQATEAHWPLIRGWLGMPAVQAWWGPQATIEAEVMMALASPHAICRLIVLEGEPVGYAHAFDAALWGENLPDGLAPGTWDLDLFIASAAHRGQGIGAQALALLKQEVFATTLAVAVCVFPSIANERAVRAYEKAGFSWRRVVADPVHGRSWFMVAQRP